MLFLVVLSRRIYCPICAGWSTLSSTNPTRDTILVQGTIRVRLVVKLAYCGRCWGRYLRGSHKHMPLLQKTKRTRNTSRNAFMVQFKVQFGIDIEGFGRTVKIFRQDRRFSKSGLELKDFPNMNREAKFIGKQLHCLTRHKFSSTKCKQGYRVLSNGSLLARNEGTHLTVRYVWNCGLHAALDITETCKHSHNIGLRLL